MKQRNDYFKLIQQYPELFKNPENPSVGIHIVTEPPEIDYIESVARQNLIDKKLPPEWSDVGIAHQDNYTLILRDAVLFPPDGKPGTYIRQVSLSNKSGAAILPIYNDSICLIKIFRHALRKFVLEIPRGYGEEGQSDEENARRELKEEINGETANIQDLGYMVDNSGTGNNRVALFIAKVDSIGDSQQEEGIDNLVLMPKDQFLNMIQCGEIEDAFTICAAMKAMLLGHL